MRKGFFLLVILLFPSIIYMLFSLGTHNVERLGFYGDYVVSDSRDTMYASVPDLQLKEAMGENFALYDLRDQVVVLDVIDWPCDEPCRKKGVTLANYLVDVENKEQWTVLSVCLNPDVSENELADFASKHLAEGVQWRFVKADTEEELQELLSYIFLKSGKLESLGDLPSKDFVLLDRDLKVRAFFDSRIYKENKKLEDAIKLIIQEPYISWKERKN